MRNILKHNRFILLTFQHAALYHQSHVLPIPILCNPDPRFGRRMKCPKLVVWGLWNRLVSKMSKLNWRMKLKSPECSLRTACPKNCFPFGCHCLKLRCLNYYLTFVPLSFVSHLVGYDYHIANACSFQKMTFLFVYSISCQALSILPSKHRNFGDAGIWEEKGQEEQLQEV